MITAENSHYVITSADIQFIQHEEASRNEAINFGINLNLTEEEDSDISPPGTQLLHYQEQSEAQDDTKNIRLAFPNNQNEDELSECKSNEDRKSIANNPQIPSTMVHTFKAQPKTINGISPTLPSSPQDELKTAEDVTVVNGMIYNSKGYQICGALNKFGKPCQRIGSNCPFHTRDRMLASAAHLANTVASPVETPIMPPPPIEPPPAPVPELIIRSPMIPPMMSLAPTPPIEKKSSVKKEPYKRGWTKEEHVKFLRGLQYHGKGSWKDIAAYVGTRSPSQIQVHAHRYFLRQQQEIKTKRSIHDFTLTDLDTENNKMPTPPTSNTNGQYMVAPTPIYSGNTGSGLVINPHTPAAYYATPNTPQTPSSPNNDMYSNSNSPTESSQSPASPTHSTPQSPAAPVATAPAAYAEAVPPGHTIQLVPVNIVPWFNGQTFHPQVYNGSMPPMSFVPIQIPAGQKYTPTEPASFAQVQTPHGTFLQPIIPQTIQATTGINIFSQFPISLPIVLTQQQQQQQQPAPPSAPVEIVSDTESDEDNNDNSTEGEEEQQFDHTSELTHLPDFFIDNVNEQKFAEFSEADTTKS